MAGIINPIAGKTAPDHLNDTGQRERPEFPCTEDGFSTSSTQCAPSYSAVPPCSEDVEIESPASLEQLDAPKPQIAHKQSITMHVNADKNMNFKPVALRKRFLTPILVVILVLSSLTILAIYTLPDGTHGIPPISEYNTTAHIIGARKYDTRQSDDDDFHEAQRGSPYPLAVPAEPTIQTMFDGKKILKPSFEARDTGLPVSIAGSHSQSIFPRITSTPSSAANVKTCYTTTWLHTQTVDAVTITIHSNPIETPTNTASASDECDKWVTVTKDQCPICEDSDWYYLTVGRNTVTITLEASVTTTADASKESDNQGNPRTSDSRTSALVTSTPKEIDVVTITLLPTSSLPPKSSISQMTLEETLTEGGTEFKTTRTAKGATEGTVVATVDTARLSASDSSSIMHTATFTTPGDTTTHSSLKEATGTLSSHVSTLSSTLSNPAGFVTETTQVEVHMTDSYQSSGSREADYITDLTEDHFLTQVGTTYLAPDGKATTTSDYLVYASVTLTTLRDPAGKPTATQTLAIVQSGLTSTFLNADGVPTMTLTFFWSSSTSILTDSNGNPTSTMTTIVAETVSTTVLTDANGQPTRTQTYLNPIPTESLIPAGTNNTDSSKNGTIVSTTGSELLRVYGITNGEYFVGLILPTLFATLLGMPIRMLDYNAKLYQPFHALATSKQGATASQSILFKTKSPWTTLQSYTHLRGEQSLLRLTGGLVLLSAILVPVSTEAVRCIVQGDNCDRGQGNAQNCAIALGVFPTPGKVVVVLLATMAVLIVATTVLLRRWRTGIRARSWNMLAMSRFASHSDMRLLLRQIPDNGRIPSEEVRRSLERQSYTLGSWEENGIVMIEVVPQKALRLKDASPKAPVRTSNHRTRAWHVTRKQKAMSIFWLTIYGRLLTLSLSTGVLILIAIYPHFRNTGTGFTHFMDSESMGVRILFSSVGIVITMFWNSYFQCKRSKTGMLILFTSLTLRQMLRWSALTSSSVLELVPKRMRAVQTHLQSRSAD